MNNNFQTWGILSSKARDLYQAFISQMFLNYFNFYNVPKFLKIYKFTNLQIFISFKITHGVTRLLLHHKY